jgi:GPH family glycoside/pentoside/hexuronide:cation symporter
VFLGVLTAWGLSRLVGGLFDSLADPFVGYGSDRSRSRLGRRRAYLAAGILPMVLAPVALFWPPGPPGSALNFAHLTVGLVVYYVFFTVYVGPYLALIPELAHDTAERIDLTAIQAVTSLPAMVLYPALWLAGVEAGRAAGLGTADAVRAVVCVSAAASLVLCALPLWAVDERRFARPEPSALPLGAALRATLRNGPFGIYLAAQICFILGVTMLQPAIPYVAVVLLGRGEGFGAWLALASVPSSVAGFFAIRWLGRRVGPRRSIMACVGVLGLATAALGGMRPDVPGGPRDALNLALAFGSLALAGFSLAGFFVLPHVLMGQVIDIDARRTGANRSAMFYGVQGLLTKWVYAASLALLSFLFTRFGNSADAPLGVILVGPVAAVLCAASVALYACYPEDRLLAEAEGS